jgi:TPR repeat protein
LFWQSIANSTNRADFEAYLQQFPQGVFAPLARNRLAALTPPAAPAPAPPPSSSAEILASIGRAPSAPPPTPAPPAPAAAADSAWPPSDRASVQAAFNLLGYRKGAISGDFDEATRAAIKRWQAFEGLDETGQLTPAARDRLLNDSAELGLLLPSRSYSPRGAAADSVKGAEARFDLGASFERGVGKPKDAAEAAYWYALAARDGWPAAFTNLGTLYARGVVGGKPDTAAAERLWKAAAARDDAIAMFNLGAMYERGIGVPADAGVAKRWYARGAEHKHAASAEALRRLGG